jgi:small redox-active disulfide protein 2
MSKYYGRLSLQKRNKSTPSPSFTKCQQTEKIVKEALAEAGVDAAVGHVTETMEIAGYGVFGTPAVVIDGQVKSVGKVPKKEDVKSWFAE